MKSLTLNLPITKANFDDKGRMVWKSAVSADVKDKAKDRFDSTLLDDLKWAFDNVEPKPFLDICHLSSDVYDPDLQRAFQAGTVSSVWRDGKYLKAEGFFDETPLGKAAFFQAARQPKGTIRTSVDILPDWEAVSFETDGEGDEVRVFKGGSHTARFRRIALTSVPMNEAVDLEVALTRSQRVTLEDDLMAVLGDAGLVSEVMKVRRAKLKSMGMPGSVEPVLIKGESAVAGIITEDAGDVNVAVFIARSVTAEAGEGAIPQATRAAITGILPKTWGALVFPPEWTAEGVADRSSDFLDWTNYAWPIHSPEQRAAVGSVLARADFDQYGYLPKERARLERKLVRAGLSEGEVLKAGPMSFVQALADFAAQEKVEEALDATYMLQDVICRVMCSDMITDKVSAVRDIINEFADYAGSEVLKSMKTIKRDDGMVVYEVEAGDDLNTVAEALEAVAEQPGTQVELTAEQAQAVAAQAQATQTFTVPATPRQVEANTFLDFINASGSGTPPAVAGTHVTPGVVPQAQPAVQVQASQVASSAANGVQPAVQGTVVQAEPVIQLTRAQLQELLTGAVSQAMSARPQSLRRSQVPAGYARVTPSAFVTRSQAQGDPYAGMNADQICRAVVDQTMAEEGNPLFP